MEFSTTDSRNLKRRATNSLTGPSVNPIQFGDNDMDEKVISRFLQADIKVYTGRLFVLLRKLRDTKEAVVKLESHSQAGTTPPSLKIVDQISLPKEATVQLEIITNATKELEKTRVSQVLDARRQTVTNLFNEITKLTTDFRSTTISTGKDLFKGIEPSFKIDDYIDGVISDIKRSLDLKLNLELIAKKKKAAAFELNRQAKLQAQEAAVDKKDETVEQLINRKVDQVVAARLRHLQLPTQQKIIVPQSYGRQGGPKNNSPAGNSQKNWTGGRQKKSSPARPAGQPKKDRQGDNSPKNFGSSQRKNFNVTQNRTGLNQGNKNAPGPQNFSSGFIQRGNNRGSKPQPKNSKNGRGKVQKSDDFFDDGNQSRKVQSKILSTIFEDGNSFQSARHARNSNGNTRYGQNRGFSSNSSNFSIPSNRVGGQQNQQVVNMEDGL